MAMKAKHEKESRIFGNAKELWEFQAIPKMLYLGSVIMSTSPFPARCELFSS
jgi:hypothetical protein